MNLPVWWYNPSTAIILK